MENEISAGLKNAMERGESLEHAMQTFVNAGYNPQEVKAAGASLSQGSSSGIVYAPGERKENYAEEKNQAPEEKGKSKKTILVIVLILAAIIFLGALGYLIFKFVGQ